MPVCRDKGKDSHLSVFPGLTLGLSPASFDWLWLCRRKDWRVSPCGGVKGTITPPHTHTPLPGETAGHFCLPPHSFLLFLNGCGGGGGRGTFALVLILRGEFCHLWKPRQEWGKVFPNWPASLLRPAARCFSQVKSPSVLWVLRRLTAPGTRLYSPCHSGRYIQVANTACFSEQHELWTLGALCPLCHRVSNQPRLIKP